MQGQLALRRSPGRLLAFAFAIAVALLLSATGGYWLRSQAPVAGAPAASAPAISSQALTPFDGSDPAIYRPSQAQNPYDGRDPAASGRPAPREDPARPVRFARAVRWTATARPLSSSQGV